MLGFYLLHVYMLWVFFFNLIFADLPEKLLTVQFLQARKKNPLSITGSIDEAKNV